MTQTELVYLSSMSLVEADATVQSIAIDGERCTVVLDRTIFYPQGGGQPYDTGTIEGPSGSLSVREVRWVDGVVHHIGVPTGELHEAERVHLSVDRERRSMHTRLHSAGHVVDMAVDRLGLGWIPGKGYHFPQGPYVEYAGSLDGDREETMARIEETAGEILSENHETSVREVPPDQLASICRFVPDYIPAGKPARVVTYGEFGVACGGTHVRTLDEIGRIRIRKLKPKGATVRVSYEIDS